MFKRIAMIGIISVSLLIAGTVLSAPAKANAGFADNIAQTAVSQRDDEVPLTKTAANVVLSQHETRMTPKSHSPKIRTNKCGFYAVRAGWRGNPEIMAAAICLAESGGRSSVWHCDSSGEDGYYPHVNCSGQFDRGLWQLGSTHTSISNACAFNARCNSRQAYKISDGGRNWSAWTTYTSGQYKATWKQAIKDIAYGQKQLDNLLAWWPHFRGRFVVKIAEKEMGCPYVWGGIGPCNSGFDCSGLMYSTFHKVGQFNIPRTANDIMHWAISVRLPIPGDLIFYGYPGYASHVAMYIGHGKAVEALNQGVPIGIFTVNYPGNPIAFGRVPFHLRGYRA